MRALMHRVCLLFIHPRAPNGNHSTYLKGSSLVAVYRNAAFSVRCHRRRRSSGQNIRTPIGSAVCTFPKAAYRPWPGRKHRHYAADLWSISKGLNFGTGRAARPFVVRLLGLAAPACSCAWTVSQSSGAMIDGCWPS